MKTVKVAQDRHLTTKLQSDSTVNKVDISSVGGNKHKMRRGIAEVNEDAAVVNEDA